MKCHRLILPVLLLIAAGLNGCAAPSAPVPRQGNNVVAAVRYVQANGLNLRECPSTQCRILARLGRGEPITILREQGGWSEVRRQDGGKAGWASSKYLGSRPPAAAKAGRGRARSGPAVPEEEFAPTSPEPVPQVEEEFGPPGDAGQKGTNTTAPPPVSEEFGK